MVADGVVSGADFGPPGTTLDTRYRLEDRYRRESGRIFLSGTQALVRALVLQRVLDAKRGWNTAGFVSGYRGSPLGGVDQEIWHARALMDAHQIRFLPAINEELGATAVLGSQRVEADPERTVDGVFGLWYGKGPGVDRAGDALRHGNAFGSSPHGGVVVLVGDDHGCVSSSMPHQSDFTLAAWSIPVLHPANIAELIEALVYGWALSRFSGAWVAVKAISETVESSSSVDLDRLRLDFQDDLGPPDAFPGGLHNRWPDLPSLSIEARLAAKLEAVRAFAARHTLDRLVVPAPDATIGIVTCGKAHLDLMEALRRLDLSLSDLEGAGVRLYQVTLAFPVEPQQLGRFAQGLEEILVVEEKGPLVEDQLRRHFYNRAERPRIVGKRDTDESPLLSALGELRPSRVMPVFAAWLARHRPALDRRARVVDFVPPPLLSNEADGVRRSPYFCSGCPHNTSTRVPAGSVAHAGIGCHFMASWMERDTVGLIQMGGEGVDWAAQAPFTRRSHIFQNLGDGTYFHSGILALRQAVAAGARITYKILYNDAVAMTGGQPIDGSTSVPQIARQVEAEGITALAVVSDDPDKYRGHESEFPRQTQFYGRGDMNRVQEMLRELPGVTVLIYDQACAAEKRRRRKKGELPDPARRLYINAEVCEGCGDCGVASNCLSVEPIETPHGRKRRINQTSCNKDYACVEGFCPSFVSVEGARPHRALGAAFDAAVLQERVAALPQPRATLSDAPYDLLVAGVGGTGVVTVGALVAMAAHLEGRFASTLDFMGFAQKGGSVLSFVRIADRSERLNQVRIDAQQADLILACDLVVGASADALATARHGRTQLIVNEHEVANDAFIRHPDAELHAPALFAKMEHAVGACAMRRCDAHHLALRLLGDGMGQNILLLGYAWQCGTIPITFAALDRALELNGVAVEMNRIAFALGRLAAADPSALDQLARGELAPEPKAPRTLEAIVAEGEARLARYQNAALARRYAELVRAVAEAETALAGAPGEWARAVALQYVRLLAYKDEYEVARLYTDGQFRASLAAAFEGVPGRDYRLSFHMAPPLLARPGPAGTPQKMRLGAWLWPAMKLLARARLLRGTPLDPFGYTRERQIERQLGDDYAALMRRLIARLDRSQLPQAAELARLPEQIRGFGHVKLDALRRVKAREADLARTLGVYEQPRGAIASVLAEAPARRVIPLRWAG